MQEASVGLRRTNSGRLSALVLLTCLLSSLASAGAPKLAIGDLPPQQLGKSATGERVNLADYRGRVIILTFWASWCSPCRHEMVTLSALQSHVSKENLTVVAVNWRESRETFRQVERILKQHKVDLTLVSDESGHLGKQYDVDAIPHMLIIGRDGLISSIHLGYAEGEIPELVEEINALLAKAPAT